MANQTGNTMSGLSSKQKIIGVVAVILLGVVIWQIIGLFTGDNGSASAPVTTTPVKSNSIMSANGPSSMNQAPNAPKMTAPNMTPLPPAAPQQIQAAAMVSSDDKATSEMIKDQEKNQIQYLGSLNKLQNLKVEREIAETSQAIATAKLTTAKAEKDMSDLLTQTTQKQQISLQDYANKLAANPTNALTGMPPTGPATVTVSTTKETAATIPAPEYVVLSVSMLRDKWNAIIGNKGKLYNVSVGDVLPDDNSIVTAINTNGVTLRVHNQSHMLHIMNPIEAGN